MNDYLILKEWTQTTQSLAPEAAAKCPSALKLKPKRLPKKHGAVVELQAEPLEKKAVYVIDVSTGLSKRSNIGRVDITSFNRKHAPQVLTSASFPKRPKHPT